MITALKSGYATASKDMGHTGGGVECVLGHPELVVDYCYRAVHEMTLNAKRIVEFSYPRFPL